MHNHMFSPEIKKQIKALCVYDNYHAVVALLLNYFLIAAAVYLAEMNLYFLPITLLVIGSRQRALATLLHEAAHGVLAKNKKLNRLIGEFFSGGLVYQTWSSYRASHVMAHHHKLGDKDKDPDFQFYLKSGVYENKSRRAFFFQYLVCPILFVSSFSSLKYLLVHRLFQDAKAKELAVLLVSHSVLAAVGTYFAGAKFYFLYWLLPYLTVFQAITWFIELAEHYPIVANAQSNLYATRNRFSHPVEQVLTGMHGENFHLIHHLFPSVPFWNMQRAHRILLQDTEYARINSTSGGIFWSANYAHSMWSTLLRKPKYNFIEEVKS